MKYKIKKPHIERRNKIKQRLGNLSMRLLTMEQAIAAFIKVDHAKIDVRLKREGVAVRP